MTGFDSIKKMRDGITFNLTKLIGKLNLEGVLAPSLFIGMIYVD